MIHESGRLVSFWYKSRQVHYRWWCQKWPPPACTETSWCCSSARLPAASSWFAGFSHWGPLVSRCAFSLHCWPLPNPPPLPSSCNLTNDIKVLLQSSMQGAPDLSVDQLRRRYHRDTGGKFKTFTRRSIYELKNATIKFMRFWLGPLYI